MTSVINHLGQSTLPEIPKFLQVRAVLHGLRTFTDSQGEEFLNYRTAAHVFIWAPWEGKSLFGTFRAAIMMQLRFDGTFGFPGGIVKGNEDVLVGLNRELQEEIGWDISKHKVTWQHYYNTRVDANRKFRFHFFIVPLTYIEFEELERRTHYAQDYGSEVLGTVRVPLYTMVNNYGGFPSFLNNKFVDLAKHQLLLALCHTNIFTEEELEETTEKSLNMKLAPSRF